MNNATFLASIFNELLSILLTNKMPFVRIKKEGGRVINTLNFMLITSACFDIKRGLKSGVVKNLLRMC
jgi:hypothetical protein